QAHQHAADRAVAADKVLDAALEGGVDDRTVDRIEHDDGIVGHAQGAGRVDPDAVPACRAQLGIDSGGVVAALGGDDDGQLLESLDVIGVLQRARAFGPGGRLAAGVAGGKKDGLEKSKIVLVAHALHEDGTHHATPADQTYCLGHMAHFYERSENNSHYFSAFNTASPISEVETLVRPCSWMSTVRKPCSSTRCTAASMRSACSASP